MGDDPIRRTGRLRFQFTLWSLLWLVALSSVFLAAFRGLGVDGLLISLAAVLGAIAGSAFGESIGTGRLRSFGAVGGGAFGGIFCAGPWATPVGFGIGLAVGACWLLLTAGVRLAADGGECPSIRPPSVHERLRETRKSLLEAALAVAVGGILLATVLGTVSFATANPLDRWFLAPRVFVLSGGAALLVSLTLAGLSLLLALAGRQPTEDETHENNDDEDR